MSAAADVAQSSQTFFSDITGADLASSSSSSRDKSKVSSGGDGGNGHHR